MTPWNRIQYQQPSNWRLLDSQHFRNYIQEHILGYFSREMPTTEVSEPSMAGPSFRRTSINSEISVAADSHITDFTNVTGMTNMTTRSDISRLSQTSRYSRKPELSSTEHLLRVTAELINSTHIKIFEGSHLKIFSSALFRGDSLWICGWNKSGFNPFKSMSFSSKDNVFLNVQVPDFSVLTKKKKEDSDAEVPTIMFASGDYIMYAKKKGSEVFSFHTQNHTFRKRYSRDSLSIAAMCGSDHNVFILNEKEPKFITVLHASLQPEGKIATHLIEMEVKDCSFDICLIKSKLSNLQNIITMDHTIIICSSSPHGSIRAVNQTQGKIWQLDCRSNPGLSLTFNPCSVSSDDNGSISIADQGRDTVGLEFYILEMFSFLCLRNKPALFWLVYKIDLDL